MIPKQFEIKQTSGVCVGSISLIWNGQILKADYTERELDGTVSNEYWSWNNIGHCYRSQMQELIDVNIFITIRQWLESLCAAHNIKPKRSELGKLLWGDDFKDAENYQHWANVVETSFLSFL